MKNYDSHEPFISLHIPKCAGQSFRQVLDQLFPGRLFFHYYQQRNALPEKHPLEPGICIHGHFNRSKGFGVMDYYPEVHQFITVLRDPLEAAISNYFYWKTKARANQLKNGIITEGGEHDYRDIEDFFCKRSRSNMLDFMPRDMNRENYKEIIETQFVWIGLVENLHQDIDRLAGLLGLPPVQVNRVNSSARDENLSPHIREAFITENQLEFEIYHYQKFLGVQGPFFKKVPGCQGQK
ncbi:MAG: sulfotransferase family 2 domain-containing protein [Candidatus Aminicenantes bacterium]|nr:sulfotransferase family 2 domain-containing protein [Candidatus Aminicenantes bacterium]